MAIAFSTASNIFMAVLLNVVTALCAASFISVEFRVAEGDVSRASDFPFTEISFACAIGCAVTSSYFFLKKKDNVGFLIAVVPLILSSLILAALRSPSVLNNAVISLLITGFNVPFINGKKWLFALPGAFTLAGSLVLAAILENH